MKNFELDAEHNQNIPQTIRIDLRNEYKDSEHSLGMFPDVIQLACHNKTLLDLQYIVQSNETGKLFIERNFVLFCFQAFEMPNLSPVEYPESSKRKRRYAMMMNGKHFCPSRYCKEGNVGECKQKLYPEPKKHSWESDKYAWEWKTVTAPISSMCTTRHGFGSTCERDGRKQSLPSCWYDIGSVKVKNDLETLGTKEIPILYHYANIDMFCMPCCSFYRINDINKYNLKSNSKRWQEKTDIEKQTQMKRANENKNNMPSKLFKSKQIITSPYGFVQIYLSNIICLSFN